MTSADRKLAPVDQGAINKALHDFDYQGWKVKVELDGGSSEGIVSGHADLFEQSRFVCRVMLSARHRDGSSAMQALARKARELIDQRQLQGND
ncbi:MULTISPECIES: hypothetical protein [unclassified Variovorax]|uniref:hypothetical protein n=1 Tax=unclassified Variovorax TaxID=663243 RepID=UPI00076D7E4F|nr:MULTISPECIES: hypothetical protein [unclassified Variovorax]KWT96998.1 hypothetical protein APY03_2000 [Variovorax sp. WDL1]PNG58554.1 hypothetical protein CHC07_00279 [Variovorax sp. B4]PNG61656.1 hypothetical protein CHC06_01557 [Variovorax sp. B2]VTV12301.1 hypothetical protein WDL1CHR_03108 [Variovorax sp. WDL1]